MASTTRKSVPLTEEELADLDLLRSPDTPEHAALDELLSIGDNPSEASVLLALLRLGRQRVSEAVMERGYADMAASEGNDDRAAKRALRQRLIARSVED
jgi:hypothetical protein